MNDWFVGHTDGWTLAVTAALAVITVVSRSFFLSPSGPGRCRSRPNAACSTRLLPQWPL